MDGTRIEGFLKAQFEPLQYAAFFGALVLFGALELLAGRGKRAERKGRWPAKWALTAINILVLGAMPVSAIALADRARAVGWGLLNVLPLAPAAALLTGLLLRSGVSYGTHVALHKIPWLWRLHRVHHADPEMDVSTTVRFHPLEFVVSTPVLLAATLLLGLPPVALILYELLDAAMAIFTHADIRLPKRLDRALRLLLVTPDMHRTHHSRWQPETDSNFGATFSVWDRLFGTYREGPPGGPEPGRLGLAEWQGREASSLFRLLLNPFRSPGAAAAGPGGRD